MQEKKFEFFLFRNDPLVLAEEGELTFDPDEIITDIEQVDAVCTRRSLILSYPSSTYTSIRTTQH